MARRPWPLLVVLGLAGVTVVEARARATPWKRRTRRRDVTRPQGAEDDARGRIVADGEWKE